MSRTYSVKPGRLFIAMVLIPLALAVAYYVFFAADRFVSSAQVVVRQDGGASAAPWSDFSQLFTGSNSASREETLYLREYIVSMEMMELLEERLNWIEQYSGQQKDVFFRLRKDMPREEMLVYYQRMVTAHYDEVTGLLKVQVQAFTPDLAEQMVKVILRESEQFVNELSHSMAREQMRFAVQELEGARAVFTQRQDALLQFQHENKVLDGNDSAKSRADIIHALEAEYSKAQIAATEMLYKLSSNSPQVKQQRQRVDALREQLEIEKQVLVSAPGGVQLNVQASRFQQLRLDAGIAEQIYKTAVTAVDNARIEASKKIRTLVTVVGVNKPHIALYPRRIYNLLTILLALFAVYGITRFVIASIEDHRE